MSYQVLARKWRPKTFAETVGQEYVLQALINALNQQRLHHAYLFTGTRGVGKTTIARILAKCLNCEIGITATPCGKCSSCQEIDAGRFIDLIEVDAASRTKVEDTRELLDNVQYAPSKGRFKVYLIDEVHMLSGHSFNALLKTLEEPPPHVKFLLATTDPQKLPETVLSRCLQFHLKNLLPEQIAEQFQYILTQENIPFELPALQQLSKAAQGSLRDGLSLLDQSIAFSDANIKTDLIKTMLGTIEDSYLFDLMDSLIQQDANGILKTIAQMAERTYNFTDAVDNLISLLHHITIVQAVPNDIPSSWDNVVELKQLATQLTAEEVQLYYQIALIGRRDLPLTPDPRGGFEMVLLRMLAFTPKKITDTKPLPKSSIEPPPLNLVSDWENIIPALKLTGSALAIANHCTLANINENTVQLRLDPSQKPLLNDKVKARLSQALSEYYDKTMVAMIEIGEGKLVTPAVKDATQRQAKQQAITEAIKQDANVQALMEAFDAKIIPDSVKAKE